MSDATKYNYVANSIILLLIWLVIWNFGVVGYEVYKGIVSFCVWLKLKCKGKKAQEEAKAQEEEEEGDLSDRV